MKISRFLIIGAVIALLACGKPAAKRLKHGLYEAPSHTLFWVAIDGEMEFMLAAPKSEETVEELENWQDAQFNVYYTLRCDGKRTPMLVYGELGAGIITAAYRDDPLDLEAGNFFIDKGGSLVQMTPDEKKEWSSKIDQR